MEIGEDILIETIERDCPFCNKVHTIEIRKRQSQLTIKDELVDFDEIYYRCPFTNPDDPENELGNEFWPAGILDENLDRARIAYRKKYELPKIVQTIRASFDPETIYLFGSYIAGKPDKHSDLDICIIFRQMTGRKINVIRRIRRTIADIITIPVDLLVYTATEFNERATLTASIEHYILEHGMRIYEIEQHGQLDEGAVDGCYTMPRPANEQKYDLRALSEYAKKEGIYLSQLSDEELKKFQK